MAERVGEVRCGVLAISSACAAARAAGWTLSCESPAARTARDGLACGGWSVWPPQRRTPFSPGRGPKCCSARWSLAAAARSESRHAQSAVSADPRLLDSWRLKAGQAGRLRCCFLLLQRLSGPPQFNEHLCSVAGSSVAVFQVDASCFSRLCA